MPSPITVYPIRPDLWATSQAQRYGVKVTHGRTVTCEPFASGSDAWARGVNILAGLMVEAGSAEAA